MIYLKEPNTNQIIEFQSEASIGIYFENWARLDEEESLVYELEKAKTSKLNTLKRNREAFQYSNIEFSNDTFKVTKNAQNKLANKIAVFVNLENEIFIWNNAFDKQITLTLEEAKSLLAAMVNRENLAYGTYSQKINEINACENLEELANININFN